MDSPPRFFIGLFPAIFHEGLREKRMVLISKGWNKRDSSPLEKTAFSVGCSKRSHSQASLALPLPLQYNGPLAIGFKQTKNHIASIFRRFKRFRRQYYFLRIPSNCNGWQAFDFSNQKLGLQRTVEIVRLTGNLALPPSRPVCGSRE